jgi:hypothetical protein
MLLLAIEKSEIPLRFEPGAAEAVAGPVTDVLKAWILAHQPEASVTPFDRGRAALIRELLEEIDGNLDLPG